MKKHSLVLMMTCCVFALSLVGCVPKSGVDNTESESAQNEVDYSMYNFVDVEWIRDTECDETLCFLSNGEFRYSCACGNPVNDADVVESYTYDDTTKMFTLNCYEEIEDMITEIKLISCDGKKLELDFDGEIRTFESESLADNVVLPLPNPLNIDNLSNCTVNVSLEQGDAYVDDDGVMQMDVTVYLYDIYDMVDIAALKVGDVIVIRGEEVTVTSLEQNERGLLINGGLDANGYELRTDENNVWYECGYSDIKSYYELGKVMLRVSPDMCFYDSSDLDKGECIYYPGDFLVEDTEFMYHFVPNNTSIVIEDGMIVEIYRRYTP